MNKHIALLFLFCLTVSLSFAQNEPVQLPYSFSQKNISMNVDRISLPEVDIARLLREDEAKTDKMDLFRTGVGHSVNANLYNSGRTDIMPDGGKLWRIQFTSKDAIMVYLVFDHFNIPEEGQFFIYSPDHEQVYGPYTNEDMQTTGRFESDNIIGDELVVEYYEPANTSFNGEFNIAAVLHIYKDFLHLRSEGKGPHGEADGGCHLDVACPEVTPWQYPVNSVVFISTTVNEGYSTWSAYVCSGAMINNVRMDKTPYVLSANHCVLADDQTYKFYFNYQTSICGGGDGEYSQVAKNGVIIARSSPTDSDPLSTSDFLLLKITGRIGESFRDNIFFAGWDRSGAASVGICIHHPQGDWKKASIPQRVSNNASYGNRFFAVNWKTSPNKGTTEGGSSGSPLFNANSLIIGTLTGGGSSCATPDAADLYGKFSHHWLNNGATADSRKLQPWLDPDNTGTVVLQGMTYGGQVITGLQGHTQSYTFSVVPNPTRDGRITINGEFIPENAICHIYNVMGQLVMTQNVTTDASFDMNVGDLNNGVYLIELVGADRTYKSKLIISK